MYKLRPDTIVAVMVTVSFLLGGLAQPAAAGIITTETARALQERNARLARVDAALSRASVERQLVTLGVDPENARERVRQLGDRELWLLEQRIDSMPAGAGALELLGAVLLVLLVLELVGVTDVFTSL